MKRKSIAIIGAGFSGLASAWHLMGDDVDITLIDPGEVGENASGLAAGLLHPYPGAHSKLVKNGNEGFAATLALAKSASKALGKSVIQTTGILRVAISDAQKTDFRFCAEKHRDVRWCTAEECQTLQPGVEFHPGILITSGCIIDTRLYLQGLWKACQSKGVRWEKRKISSLAELDHYTAIVVSMGAEITSLPELSTLPVKPVKGQLLEMEWPKELPPLQIPVNSQAYIIKSSDSKCIVGATFEKEFASPDPDLKTALEYLKPRMCALFPALGHAKIISCRAGVRASAPNHLPLVKQVNERTWVISGMGSKGLLYHALYAGDLAEKIKHAPYLSVSS